MSIDAKLLLTMVASTLPVDLHPHVLVVGSLAAAYHHRDRLGRQAVNTKDADIIVHPAGAIAECVSIARQLLVSGWRPTDKCYPQGAPDPVEQLRAIRLHPPQSDAFFIELLGLPQEGQHTAKTWVPCQLDDGWYGMPCFRFMRLLKEDRRETDLGIQHASPALMALANLLSHPSLGTERMSADIGGHSILRSAKDLGRVLALAHLEPQPDLEGWLDTWEMALRSQFPKEASSLADRAGAGLAELLADATALDQAHVTTDIGLLGGLDVTVDQLRIAGQRLRQDLLEPLRSRFS